MNLDKIKIYIGFLIFSVIFGVIFRFALIPSAKGFKESSALVRLEEKAAALFLERKNNFQVFKENKSYYENIKNELEGHFAKTDAPINFIEFLEEEAENFRLSVKIQPMAVKPEQVDLWESVGFQISLFGSFPESLKFLQRLEQGPFLSDILQLNIDKISEEKLKQKEFEKAKKGDVSVLLAVKVFSGSPLDLKKEK